MFALVSILSVATVPARADEPEPLRCTFELSIDIGIPDPHWAGTISGDIEGTIDLWERWSEIRYPGATEHFFEDFTITTDQGIIKGFDKGVWNFATYKFRSVGFVTEVTPGDLAYLLGYKAFMIGFTSEFPPSEGTIVTGSGTMMLAPP